VLVTTPLRPHSQLRPCHVPWQKNFPGAAAHTPRLLKKKICLRPVRVVCYHAVSHRPARSRSRGYRGYYDYGGGSLCDGGYGESGRLIVPHQLNPKYNLDLFASHPPIGYNPNSYRGVPQQMSADRVPIVAGAADYRHHFPIPDAIVEFCKDVRKSLARGPIYRDQKPDGSVDITLEVIQGVLWNMRSYAAPPPPPPPPPQEGRPTHQRFYGREVLHPRATDSDLRMLAESLIQQCRVGGAVDF
jgi:hypothetical protein